MINSIAEMIVEEYKKYDHPNMSIEERQTLIRTLLSEYVSQGFSRSCVVSHIRGRIWD